MVEGRGREGQVVVDGGCSDLGIGFGLEKMELFW